MSLMGRRTKLACRSCYFFLQDNRIKKHFHFVPYNAGVFEDGRWIRIYPVPLCLIALEMPMEIKMWH
jgi:hypothetical protein